MNDQSENTSIFEDLKKYVNIEKVEGISISASAILGCDFYSVNNLDGIYVTNYDVFNDCNSDFDRTVLFINMNTGKGFKVSYDVIRHTSLFNITVLGLLNDLM